MDYQIITSLFDTDWYKLLEIFYKYHFYPEAIVREETLNRTVELRIADFVPVEVLYEQLGAARTLQFSEDQIRFLQGTRTFVRDFKGFSQYLHSFSLPEYEIQLKDGQYILTSEHKDAQYWETFFLSIENEAAGFYRAQKAGISQTDLWNEAERALRAKLPTLALLPPGSLLEFGTRRRFSKALQRHLWEIIQNELPAVMKQTQNLDQARGVDSSFTDFVNVMNATSNVQMAIDYCVDWAGTQPHAGILLEQGIAAPFGDSAVRGSHNLFFTRWGDLFPYNNLMALPDTYGNQAFWKDFSRENALKWRGLRWDSGPWLDFIAEARQFYYQMHIDARDPVTGKDGAFTDGLEPEDMIQIYPAAAPHFRKVVFGWGTNFTNDMGLYKSRGMKPFSLVAKPTKVNGHPVGKLSNNRGKKTGNGAWLEDLVRIFEYDLSDRQNVVPIV